MSNITNKLTVESMRELVDDGVTAVLKAQENLAASMQSHGEVDHLAGIDGNAGFMDLTMRRAELETAKYLLAIRQQAMEVLMLMRDSSLSPTKEHLSRAVAIYSENMTDENATMVEVITKRLSSELGGEAISEAAVILSSMKHLRQFHGKEYTSWDTVYDITEAIGRM
jgi:hypothetical protein